MDADRYLDALARESTALADAADAAGPDAPVPTVEGWTVADLVSHCASGDLWARRIVESDTPERASHDLPPDAPTGAALVPYFREGARRLVELLTASDPEKSVWTFSPTDRTARFWRRRRAHETAIHRFDAQSAEGTSSPIDAEMAADGIDEFLTVFVARFGQDAVTAGETLHFHCTDVAGEWLVTREGDDLRITREHAKGDVAARGSASDLMLFLWGRVPAERLEVFGDAAALDRFRSATRV